MILCIKVFNSLHISFFVIRNVYDVKKFASIVCSRCLYLASIMFMWQRQVFVIILEMFWNIKDCLIQGYDEKQMEKS